MYPKNKLAQLVIAACVENNIDTVVISPGSRNAPLTVGFSNHPTVNALSIVDERCAAFFALGIAQQTQKPVAVVCTSGSALLNYYPAIAEAYYSQIPLVVISADRPKHLIDIGDGQTIRQENVFQNHVVFSANLIDDVNAEANNTVQLLTALQLAVYKKAPVHINVPFDEPLYETEALLSSSIFDTIESVSLQADMQVAEFLQKSFYNIDELVQQWNTASKKIILVGVHHPDEYLEKLIIILSKDASVLVFTETTSNLNIEKSINSIDKLIFSLDDEELQNIQPNLLVTFGGMVVSKKIKQFLRTYQPTHHWHIDEFQKLDTFHCLTAFVQEKPVVFFDELMPKIQAIASRYQDHVLEKRNMKNKKHQTYLDTIQHSDLKVFDQVLKNIPFGCLLHLSNSSIIRYSQLFDVHPSLEVFCNRGTSGIDGSTSTAIGGAFASEKPCVFITGDLSFFYDSNALWNQYIPSNFRIIVINNSSGGIFRFIPGPKSTNALDYFETPHQLTAVHLCNMYGLEYGVATSSKEVQAALKTLYDVSESPKLLEIMTDKEINEQVLKDYFEFLK